MIISGPWKWAACWSTDRSNPLLGLGSAQSSPAPQKEEPSCVVIVVRQHDRSEEDNVHALSPGRPPLLLKIGQRGCLDRDYDQARAASQRHLQEYRYCCKPRFQPFYLFTTFWDSTAVRFPFRKTFSQTTIILMYAIFQKQISTATASQTISTLWSSVSKCIRPTTTLVTVIQATMASKSS